MPYRRFYSTGDFEKAGGPGIIPLFLGVLLIFMMSSPANGQLISISAKFDTTGIMIGEQTNFTVIIKQPADLQIQLPEVPRFLSDKIEILSEIPSDTILVDDNTLQISKSYRVTSFETGEHEAEPIPFTFFIDGSENVLNSTLAKLVVQAPEIDQEGGIYDIKEPFYVSWGLMEILPWILLVLGLAILAWYLFRYFRKQKTEMPSGEREITEPPHVVALRELDQLKSDLLWQKGLIKEYYTRLTEIVRIYIERQYGVMAMEQTSNETISDLRSGNRTDPRHVDYLSECLMLADLVKFAKARPGDDTHDECFMAAFNFVEETSRENLSENIDEANGHNPAAKNGLQEQEDSGKRT
ncbi:MAG: hypothetical protein ACFCUM_15630 [Bacteroidales bacterium]